MQYKKMTLYVSSSVIRVVASRFCIFVVFLEIAADKRKS